MRTIHAHLRRAGWGFVAAAIALAPQVRAGFVVPQHWHVRPESFNEGLAAAARELGVEILEGAEVVDFVVKGSRVAALRTAAGDYDADSVVLAAGCSQAGASSIPKSAVTFNPLASAIDPARGAMVQISISGAIRRAIESTPKVARSIGSTPS